MITFLLLVTALVDIVVVSITTTKLATGTQSLYIQIEYSRCATAPPTDLTHQYEAITFLTFCVAKFQPGKSNNETTYRDHLSINISSHLLLVDRQIFSKKNILQKLPYYFPKVYLEELVYGGLILGNICSKRISQV